MEVKMKNQAQATEKQRRYIKKLANEIGMDDNDLYELAIVIQKENGIYPVAAPDNWQFSAKAASKLIERLLKGA